MATHGLYLHIPFCAQRCTYCDFNTYTSIGDLKPVYARALAQEIEQVGRLVREDEPLAVHSIFFGGGTPSLMSVDELSHILNAARRTFSILPEAEITLEANPESVSDPYLAELRGLGINRLSYGVQSAQASELQLLGREHDFATAVAALEMARAAGFDNVNLDLIYGLPAQSLASWEATLQAVLALRPEHLSLYCLTIEPGTPLQHDLQTGRIQPPDPDLAADQYQLASEAMAAAGYTHYEISNWALGDRPSRHNLTYWRNEPYLGLGAGAHGSAGGYRYQLVRQPRAYVRRLAEAQPGPFPLSAAVADSHLVDTTEAMSDVMITQLRLLQEGLDLARFEAQFGQSVDTVYGDTVGQLESWGMLTRRDGRLLLTEQGRFLSNQVFYRFV